MTTQREAETLLFNPTAETVTANLPQPKHRRRVDATYCPLCSSWVEVRLQPVRLHCTGCGQKAKP